MIRMPLNLRNRLTIPGQRPALQKLLLASVYLNMAGFPLKEASNYALAAAKAKEVIDNKSKYGYDLLPGFADLWLNANNINRETVFGCFYDHLADPEGSPAMMNMVCPLIHKPVDFGEAGEIFMQNLHFSMNFPQALAKMLLFSLKDKKVRLINLFPGKTS